MTICRIEEALNRTEKSETGIPLLSSQSSERLSILFTHSPTWDDCQQLLQGLFTTEECERILSEAQKNVPGVDGRPTTQPNLIDERFRLTRPRWDFERAKGRERLRVYRQTLMASLRAAARKPTNLA